MRHKRGTKLLSRPTDQRLAILRAAAISLLEHGKIKMTATRAKALQQVVEPLITKAKVNDVAAHREVYKFLNNRDAVKKLFERAGKFADRPGGYTRLTKIGIRRGDAAPVSLIEFTA